MRDSLWPVRVDVVVPVTTRPVGTGDVKVVCPVPLGTCPGNTGGGFDGGVSAGTCAGQSYPCMLLKCTLLLAALQGCRLCSLSFAGHIMNDNVYAELQRI